MRSRARYLSILLLLVFVALGVIFGPRLVRRLHRQFNPVAIEVATSLEDVRRFTGDVPPWPIVISPDFDHYAIVRGGRSSTGGNLCIDQQRVHPFGSMYATTLTWSPDGSVLAGSNPGTLFVGTQTFSIQSHTAPTVCFSPDAKRWFSSVAFDGKKQKFLIDAAPKDFDPPITLFFLGNRLAHLTTDGIVVEDGQRYPLAFPDIAGFVPYSTGDGRTVLLADSPSAVGRHERRVMVVSLADGEIREFKPAFDPAISPDGSRYVFKLIRDGKMHLVIDGALGPGFHDIPRAVFAPDGRSIIWHGFSPQPKPGAFGLTRLVDHTIHLQSNTFLPELYCVSPPIEIKRDRDKTRTVITRGQTLGPYTMVVPSRVNDSSKLFHVESDGTVTFYAATDRELLRVQVR